MNQIKFRHHLLFSMLGFRYAQEELIIDFQKFFVYIISALKIKMTISIGVTVISISNNPLLNISLDEKVPYFMSDYRYVVGQIKKLLAEGSEPQRIWLTAKIMRDVRFCDVPRFISLQDFLKYREQIMPRLGRQRNFWQFLYSRRTIYGIISDENATNSASKLLFE